MYGPNSYNIIMQRGLVAQANKCNYRWLCDLYWWKMANHHRVDLF